MKQNVYLKANASGVGFVVGLLQKRDGVDCHKDEAPHKSTLRLVAFTSKSLSNMEKRHSNTEREALGILNELKVPILLLCQTSKCHHRLQGPSSISSRT